MKKKLKKDILILRPKDYIVYGPGLKIENIGKFTITLIGKELELYWAENEKVVRLN